MSPPGGPADAWLFRLSANGELIWEKTYDALTESVNNVAESTNGDLIATGRIFESGNPDQVDALLFRTTSTGDMKWLKSFGGSVIDNGSGIHRTGPLTPKSDGRILEYVDAIEPGEELITGGMTFTVTATAENETGVSTPGSTTFSLQQENPYAPKDPF